MKKDSVFPRDTFLIREKSVQGENNPTALVISTRDPPQ